VGVGVGMWEWGCGSEDEVFLRLDAKQSWRKSEGG
jgi:hypothetical protein